MPDEQPLSPLDDPGAGGGAESDPIPLYPIYPPPTPPAGFPPPGDANLRADYSALAAFGLHLRYATSINILLAGVSAVYVSQPGQPFTYTSGDFVFAAEVDNGHVDDGKHYIVFVAGAEGVIEGDYVQLLLNIPSLEFGQNGQTASSLGQLS